MDVFQGSQNLIDKVLDVLVGKWLVALNNLPQVGLH